MCNRLPLSTFHIPKIFLFVPGLGRNAVSVLVKVQEKRVKKQFGVR